MNLKEGIVDKNPQPGATEKLFENDQDLERLANKHPIIRQLYGIQKNEPEYIVPLVEILNSPHGLKFLYAIGDTAATIFRYHRKHRDAIQHRETKVNESVIKLWNLWNGLSEYDKKN